MGKGMRAGKKPSMGGGGMGNMQKQLQQVQAMQKRMEEVQAEVEKMETTATAGGGAVTVTVSGAKQVTNISLKPEVVDPDDIEMLQDLIMVAVNESLRQMEEISEQEMGKVTGGLNIPGLM
ncbi:MAG: YbaB/EbfC family nucleoid-associated protein [Aminipila sp.]